MACGATCGKTRRRANQDRPVPVTCRIRARLSSCHRVNAQHRSQPRPARPYGRHIAQPEHLRACTKGDTSARWQADRIEARPVTRSYNSASAFERATGPMVSTRDFARKRRLQYCKCGAYKRGSGYKLLKANLSGAYLSPCELALNFQRHSG